MCFWRRLVLQTGSWGCVGMGIAFIITGCLSASSRRHADSSTTSAHTLSTRTSWARRTAVAAKPFGAEGRRRSTAAADSAACDNAGRPTVASEEAGVVDLPFSMVSVISCSVSLSSTASPAAPPPSPPAPSAPPAASAPLAVSSQPQRSAGLSTGLSSSTARLSSSAQGSVCQRGPQFASAGRRALTSVSASRP